MNPSGLGSGWCDALYRCPAGRECYFTTLDEEAYRVHLANCPKLGSSNARGLRSKAAKGSPDASDFTAGSSRKPRRGRGGGSTSGRGRYSKRKGNDEETSTTAATHESQDVAVSSKRRILEEGISDSQCSHDEVSSTYSTTTTTSGDSFESSQQQEVTESVGEEKRKETSSKPSEFSENSSLLQAEEEAVVGDSEVNSAGAVTQLERGTQEDQDKLEQTLKEMDCDDHGSKDGTASVQCLCSDTERSSEGKNDVPGSEQSVTSSYEMPIQHDSLDSNGLTDAVSSPGHSAETSMEDALACEMLEKLKAPLKLRKQKLDQEREFCQLYRDIEKEKDWLSSRILTSTSESYGDSLASVELEQTIHECLKKQFVEHRPEIHKVIERFNNVQVDGQIPTDRIKDLGKSVTFVVDTWNTLEVSIQRKDVKLQQSHTLQRYLADAGEVKASVVENLISISMMVSPAGIELTPAQAIECCKAFLANAERDNRVEILRQRAQNIIKDLGLEHHQELQSCDSKSRFGPVRDIQIEMENLMVKWKGVLTDKILEMQKVLEWEEIEKSLEATSAWIAKQEEMVCMKMERLGQNVGHVTQLCTEMVEIAKELEQQRVPKFSSVLVMADNYNPDSERVVALLKMWKDELNRAWEGLIKLMKSQFEILKVAENVQGCLKSYYEALARVSAQENDIFQVGSVVSSKTDEEKTEV